MDEPFGALDALTRSSIQDELLALWQQVRRTIAMITHDVDEAIYLSDRILVMSDGPGARIAETVTVDLPRPRDRSALLRSPRYHELRAHRWTSSPRVAGGGRARRWWPTPTRHDDSGSWYRAYGNEQWEFREDGLMRRRYASINDLPIREAERRLR